MLINFIRSLLENLLDYLGCGHRLWVLLIMLPLSYLAIRAGWSPWVVIIGAVAIWAVFRYCWQRWWG